jgi:hypothetical protein
VYPETEIGALVEHIKLALGTISQITNWLPDGSLSTIWELPHFLNPLQALGALSNFMARWFRSTHTKLCVLLAKECSQC